MTLFTQWLKQQFGFIVSTEFRLPTSCSEPELWTNNSLGCPPEPRTTHNHSVALRVGGACARIWIPTQPLRLTQWLEWLKSPGEPKAEQIIQLISLDKINIAKNGDNFFCDSKGRMLVESIYKDNYLRFRKIQFSVSLAFNACSPSELDSFSQRLNTLGSLQCHSQRPLPAFLSQSDPLHRTGIFWPQTGACQDGCGWIQVWKPQWSFVTLSASGRGSHSRSLGFWR